MNFIKYFRTTDFLTKIVKIYKNIPKIDRTSFWVSFIVLNIVFAYHSITFMYSNHEWNIIKTKVAYNEFWRVGRYTLTFPYVIFGFRLVPVLWNIFSFIVISLSSIALAYYWKLPRQKSIYILFVLATSLLPYNLVWWYHVIQNSYFFAPLLIVLSLFLFEKKYGTRFFLLWEILVILGLFSVLSFNPSFLNTICICILGRYFIICLQEKIDRFLIKRFFVLGITVVLSALLLKGMMVLTEHYHLLMTNFYNIAHISLKEFPKKFLETLPFCLGQFNVTYPFIDAFYLDVLSCISLFTLFYVLCFIIKTKGFLRGLEIYVFFISSFLVASQFSAILSKMGWAHYSLRVTGYFSHYFIYAFIFVLFSLFYQKKLFKNIFVIGMMSIIWLSIVRNMHSMHVWSQGRRAENKLMARVMKRIEDTQGFNYDKRYSVLLLGEISLRPRFYQEEYWNRDPSLISWGYYPSWEIKRFLNYDAPFDFIETNYLEVRSLNPHMYSKMSTDTLKYIIEKAEYWPYENSVFIKDDILEKHSLGIMKKGIKEYLKNIKERIYTCHERWVPRCIYLEVLHDDTVIHPLHESKAYIKEFDNKKLVLEWELYGQETFMFNNEAYELK